MMARKIAASAAALILIAGCGGGDDDGGANVPNVTLTVTTPARVDASLYQGATAPSVFIMADLSGDAAALNGRTLYIFAVVTHGFLFDGTPTVNVYSDGSGGTLQLFGHTPLADVANYAGTIQVRACLDAACQEELTVVNGEIPYAIQVKRGLSFPGAPPILSTTFGTAPAPITVPVTLPEDVTTWRAAGGTYGLGQVRAEKAPDGSANVILSALELMLPGSVNQGISVTAETASGATLTKSFTVSYSTAASSEPFAFQRPSVEITLPANSQYLTDAVNADVLFPGSDSDRFDHVGTTYTWPAEAEANPRRNRWLYPYFPDEIGLPRWATTRYTAQFEAQNCYTSYDSVLGRNVTDCLPPGRYTATIQYRYSPAVGTPVDVGFPVTLDVTP